MVSELVGGLENVLLNCKKSSDPWEILLKNYRRSWATAEALKGDETLQLELNK